MAETFKCPNCSALLKELGASFCGYCGAALPADRPAPRERTKAERFVAVREHPELQKHLDHVPSTAGLEMSQGCGMVGALVFLVAALVIGGSMMGVAGKAGPGGALFVIVPLALIGIGFFVVFKSATGFARIKSAPMESRIALVVDERVHVSGGGENSSARTHYYVTLETEGGARKEHRTTDEVAGLAALGDIGVAYVKGPYVVGFKRFDV